MSRAAQPPKRAMSRAERQRLELERVASAHRSHAQRLHRILRYQSAYIVPNPQQRIDQCPELRELIACARAKRRGRFQFDGLWFSVQRRFLTGRIYGPSGHLVSYWDFT